MIEITAFEAFKKAGRRRHNCPLLVLKGERASGFDVEGYEPLRTPFNWVIIYICNNALLGYRGQG